MPAKKYADAHAAEDARRAYMREYYRKNKERILQWGKAYRVRKKQERKGLRKSFNPPLSLFSPLRAPSLPTHRFEQWAQAQIDRRHLCTPQQ